ncbi:MAG: monovalent cation/H+ antiporter complex subunit F [Eubacteriales bacterium]|jgi:multicomponent Na+:H+ antiporter subunit F|nr:monovalent cation/H+ antiporter complex subunit F [Eubacteriales bacterium]NCC81771.1 pH regulation protein F [Clostridia bacterium]
MENFFLTLLVGLLIVVISMLYRVIKGPTVYDRLNGLGVVGTSTILILITIGFIDERVDMFVDIAIAYALLGFISLIVLAKFLSD